jgi:predicted adenylyl cyclase CyaB
MQLPNNALKARLDRLEPIRAFLMEHHARLAATDYQKDTYFHVPNGKLKLRHGTIENALIHKDCSSHIDPSSGNTGYFTLEAPEVDADALVCILDRALGTKAVVEKKREIYFIDNVKFHLDEVQGLGCFVEIEAVDIDDAATPEELSAQCCQYREALGIREEDLLTHSYSDLQQL